jgi:hypothetical protein
MEVLNEMDLPAELEHVRDVRKIGQYGVMGMPALIIGGQVKCVGKVPSRNDIRLWLAETIRARVDE